MANFLFFRKIKIREANAMPCSYIVGFPAMTAWLGGVHALERFVREDGIDVRFSKTAVVAHEFHLRTHQDHDKKLRIIGKAIPLERGGGRSPLVEEAECDACVSLLIKCDSQTFIDGDELIEVVRKRLPKFRLAGGYIWNEPLIEFLSIDEDVPADSKKLLRRLMVGYALIERRDILVGKELVLDFFLDALRTNAVMEDGVWTYSRNQPGWVVPVVAGYKDLSGSAPVKRSRAPDREHHFVEPLVTLGEFVMPYRFDNVSDILWEYHYDKENGIYAVRNRKGEMIDG